MLLNKKTSYFGNKMEGMFALQNLLNGTEKDSSDDEGPSNNLGAKLGPGSIGASKKSEPTQKIVDIYGK